MKYPIKVLKDKDQNPFIPFVTTSSVVENGTNRNLDDILHNLTVPIANLNSLENTAVADMMTNMKDYKDSGFAIIYVNTDNTGLLLAFEKITTVDVLNKCWSFVSSFNADSKAYRINITGYYNADNSVFTVSSATIEEIQAENNGANMVFFNGINIGNNTNVAELQPIYDTLRKGIPCALRPNNINRIDVSDTNRVYYSCSTTGIDFDTYTGSIFFKEPSYYKVSAKFNSGDFGNQNTYAYVSLTVKNGVPTKLSNSSIVSNWENDIKYLSKTNTYDYTPTDKFHPATKQYVDDSISNVISEKLDSLPTTQDLVDNGFDYDTHTGESVEITPTMTNVSTTYGFTLNDSGYYESNNKGKANSWALCKITINTPLAFTLTIPYISSGENSYDYGIFGQLDAELANNTTDDGATGSTKVKLNCKGQASTAVKQVSYDIPAGEHFIEIKYRKDGSGDQGNDSLQFKIESSYTFVIPVYVNKKLATTDMLDTLPMMPVYYISAYNVMGTDVDITDAETLAQVNKIINSNYDKDVLLCIKDKTYKGYYMFLVMFWNKPKTSYTNTYKTFSTISLIQTEDSHRALTVLPMKFTYNTVAGEGITVTHIKYDTLNGNKKNEYILLEKFYTRIPGYNSSKTQVLKNINGTLKWVTEEVA